VPKIKSAGDTSNFYPVVVAVAVAAAAAAAAAAVLVTA